MATAVFMQSQGTGQQTRTETTAGDRLTVGRGEPAVRPSVRRIRLHRAALQRTPRPIRRRYVAAETDDRPYK